MPEDDLQNAGAGSGSSTTSGESVRPFRIAVADDVLDDLRSRLARTRWPEAECVDDWSQGIPLAYTRALADHWADVYDWRARETALNRFDQYVTEIDGLDIHFIHQRSPHDGAFPLVITHGWPGSIVEFHKVIEPLTNPASGRAEDAFHVVCPSLPGYGFSGKPTRTGWGVERIAQAWETLMLRLGYERYGAQGGDWGAAVTTQIGRNGGHCAGIHLNMPIGRPTPESLKDPTPEEQKALAALADHRKWGTGYSKQQSTRPQTLGYGLVDSPVGQLAWIVEKFWAWMDCDGHPENVLTRDELLDNVMVYWVTGTGASSARLYWESFRVWGNMGRVELPTGIASFPGEVLGAPRSWCEPVYHVTHWTDMPRGGHFAAFEQPELFVDDVRAFFATVR
ncbi:epoxide hydrolase [Mycobacterium bohemicum DSM 44277]|uniref:Epoxide hydrolase n=1 Tax=Mycobacterium bohemicum DSM 44277 TaxID=1236609 RepID=A0A0U0W2I5_MYCBE|nr:epoxide hydrolase [Mycobacterium bohemicum DSM 44277]